MTLRSLEKMPHLQEVSGITVRGSHLQFKYQTATKENRPKPLDERLNKGTSTKVKDLTPSFWCLFLHPPLSCFSPLAAIPALIRAPPLSISLTSLAFALWHEDPQRTLLHTNTKLCLCAKKKKASDYACSLSFLNWAELQISLELVRAMVFIQAKKPPGWKHVLCPFSIFTFTTGAELLFQQFPKPDRMHSKSALSKAWKIGDSFTTGIHL